MSVGLIPQLPEGQDKPESVVAYKQSSVKSRGDNTHLSPSLALPVRQPLDGLNTQWSSIYNESR